MTARYPVAYIRRSSADTQDPGDASREGQEAAIRELAHRDGHNGNLRVLVDWDRSADEAKEGKRAAFLAMLAAVERGEVDVIYAASLDRLYRSLRTFVRLTDAARAHDVRIVTAREGVLGGDGSPMAQAFAEITAVFSSLELRTTKARAAGALAVRRERGDHIGPAGYGFRLERHAAGAIVTVPDPDRPLEPVLEAVREAGSILGACMLLNARGVPVPQGPSAERRHNGTHWHPTPLRRIVERNAPELLPKAGPSGRRQPSRGSALAQLLVCHCGHVLTPEPTARAYRCTVAHRTGGEGHGRSWVSERALMPWIRTEAARFVPPGDEGPGDAPVDLEAERARIVETFRRVSRAYVAGGIGEEEYTRAERDRDAALEALTDVPDIATFGPLDWSAPPEAVNAVLRAMWRSVRLGEDMRPIEADWYEAVRPYLRPAD
jgi:DNA invertase Pin-like site-specific DNA recombinase